MVGRLPRADAQPRPARRPAWCDAGARRRLSASRPCSCSAAPLLVAFDRPGAAPPLLALPPLVRSAVRAGVLIAVALRHRRSRARRERRRAASSPIQEARARRHGAAAQPEDRRTRARHERPVPRRDQRPRRDRSRGAALDEHGRAARAEARRAPAAGPEPRGDPRRPAAAGRPRAASASSACCASCRRTSSPPSLSRDRTPAELSFGIPLLPADEQARLIDRIRPLLADAPDGVRPRPAGLLALAASSVDGLQDGRPWLLLAAAAVIFLCSSPTAGGGERAVIPLVPALLAAGGPRSSWPAAGVRLSPLSAALEPLVLAVGVEFGLLLEARYREERRRRAAPLAAARAATEARRPGRGLGRHGGARLRGARQSRLPVLQQFGLLAALELALCALAAIVIVPGCAPPPTPDGRPRSPPAAASGGTGGRLA